MGEIYGLTTARVVGGGQLASRRDLHVLPPLTVFDSN